MSLTEVDKLAVATRLVAEVQATMKTDVTQCPVCGKPEGATGGVNHQKHINHEMLGAAISRTKRVQEWLVRTIEERKTHANL